MMHYQVTPFSRACLSDNPPLRFPLVEAVISDTGSVLIIDVKLEKTKGPG